MKLRYWKLIKEINAIKTQLVVTTGTNLFQHWMQKNSKLSHVLDTIVLKVLNEGVTYYSINRPGRLLNFWTLRVGAYSRLGAYEVSPFCVVWAPEYVYFATKQ